MILLLGVIFIAVAAVVCRLFARPLLSDLSSAFAAIAVTTVGWDAVQIGFPVSDLFLTASFIALVPRLLRGRVKLALPALCALGAGVIAVCFLSVTIFPSSQAFELSRYLNYNAPHPSMAHRISNNLFTGFKYELALVVLPLVVAVGSGTRERLLRFADLWVLSATVNCLVAISDYLHLTHIRLQLAGVTVVPIGTTDRVGGLSSHANILAVSSLITLPLAALWLTRPGRWRPAGVACLAVIATGIYLSGSRSGLVVGLVTLGLVACFHPQIRRRAAVLALPATLLALAALAAIPNLSHDLLAHTRFFSANSEASNQARALLNAQALRDFGHRPITGLGFDVAQQGHSIYLEILAAGGVVGLIGWLLYLTGAFTALRLRAGGRVDYFAVALLISAFSWLLDAIFGADLIYRYPYVPMALMIGLWSISTSRSSVAFVSDVAHQVSPAELSARRPGPALERSVLTRAPVRRM